METHSVHPEWTKPGSKLNDSAFAAITYVLGVSITLVKLPSLGISIHFKRTLKLCRLLPVPHHLTWNISIIWVGICRRYIFWHYDWGFFIPYFPFKTWWSHVAKSLCVTDGCTWYGEEGKLLGQITGMEPSWFCDTSWVTHCHKICWEGIILSYKSTLRCNNTWFLKLYSLNVNINMEIYPLI